MAGGRRPRDGEARHACSVEVDKENGPAGLEGDRAVGTLDARQGGLAGTFRIERALT
jgi:hypothetical protein